MFYPNYNFLERLLHRLALNYEPIADVSFDIDQTTVKSDPREIVYRKHVFVSGLARAGSTVLMRRFHTTGCYRSLTYRDMPFVLAPNIWRRLSQNSRLTANRTERAHKDNLHIDYDSPETLDEVFWRVFDGTQYISADRLTPHAPNRDLLKKYVRYVNAILSAQEPRLHRYLSKNNNNILRLAAIHQTFPEALILIPFREPLQHAQSLLRQHIHFSEMQTRHEFVLRYMTWLGHHEFGRGHRPFLFDETPHSIHATDTLNYWLQLWCEVYSWLIRTKPASAFFVCYEDLCGRPETWRRIAELAGISAEDDSSDPLRLSEHPLHICFDERLADHAIAIYTRLVAYAREHL